MLIHYGGGSAVRSGLIDRVKASLEKEGLYYVTRGGVRPNPRSGLVYQGIDLCRREHIDFILAVGGGSSIDSSKAIAAGVPYESDFWDFYSGKPITEALPVGTVLTISAAGSEGSHNIEHELSAHYDCAHGAGLAVTMPAVFTYTLDHDVMRYDKAAVRVWGCQMDFDDPRATALSGIERLKQFLKSIGMPLSFEELGANEADIPKLVDVLCNGDGRKGSISGFVTLNEDDCEKIYRMMV